MSEPVKRRRVIETPTQVVLVVGAGAAVDYKLPTGAELRNEILKTSGTLAVCDEGIEFSRRRFCGWPNLKKEPTDLVQINPSFETVSDQQLQDSAVTLQHRFRQAFRKSGQVSIDAFAATAGGTEFATLSRRLIAAHIHAHEVRAARTGELSSHWYQLLFHLAFDDDGYPKSGLKIITFNYDQTLETALIQMVQYTHKLPVQEAKERVLGLPIDHVYGHTDLDYLLRVAESEVDADRGEPFTLAPLGAGNAYHCGREVRALAKNILLIKDERNDEERIRRRCRWVSAAKEVHYLGFGFDPDNLYVAGTHADHQLWRERLSEKRIVATAIGMSRPQKLRALNALGLVMNDDWARAVFRDTDCRSLLDEHWNTL